jgi:nucleoside-diphosphate-sugar epimerase
MTNHDTQVLVTGAAGIGGDAVCRLLLEEGFRVRAADVAPPQGDLRALLREGDGDFVRCDTRTPDDCRRAVAGCAAVVHLAAWHCAHQPPVSDETIWAVNVDGTFNVFQACRAEGIKAVAFASSMAFGWGGVYSVSKVIGEDLCRSYHESTGASVAMLRYHDFVPKPYLDFGVKLLRNGVDRRDVASATVAAIKAALAGRLGLFQTVIHTAHGLPPEAVQDFRTHGPAWCEEKVPGSRALLEKYALDLPERVEQHDMSEAKRLMDWAPQVGFAEFLRDLQERDARGEDVRALWAPGQIPAA